jgi:NAD(P)-dependent dehydrogenase (short-subunit alcohol dehydrogenase family)
MLGVWIDPVIAHVMMTFRASDIRCSQEARRARRIVTRRLQSTVAAAFAPPVHSHRRGANGQSSARRLALDVRARPAPSGSRTRCQAQPRSTLQMDLELRDLRVLVTAGASGIGLATARAFAREGARVHVCDIDEAALAALAATDPALTRSAADVSDPACVAALFADVASSLGGLDALVNNAGIAGPTAACEDVALADWQRTLAVNLTGQFLCAQRAIPLLKASRNASVANLSSAAGRFGFANRTPYAAAKWGVIGFTKSLSIELGGFGIRVNAICPGAVAGSRIDAVFANKAALRGVAPEVVRAESVAKTSLKRLVTAEDIANAIVFLASPLGANISGHAMPVDADAQSLA